jgi:hypothetical protein
MEKPYWRKKLPISTTRLSFGDIVCAVANLAGDLGKLIMETEARKPREIATTVEINGPPHGPLHGNFQLSRGIMDEERRQIGYQGKH